MTTSLEWFKANIGSGPSYRVLEIGTKQWSNRPTHHREWFDDCHFLKTDIEDGVDVDIVSDAHHLSEMLGKNRFHAIVACSVFEHLIHPWIAAAEILEALRPGGIFFVQTHQTFPIHGYPNDYYRFTKEALLDLFAGASEKYADYEFKCKTISDTIKMENPEQYLNVCIAGRK